MKRNKKSTKSRKAGVVAIIPARGGSKSIPKKNIKMLSNKPLIAYPIELAKSISAIDRVIVSTDSEEIAKIANIYGAETPFIRPKQLAKDSTPTLPVLQHAVKHLEKKEGYKTDIILLLYPTNPLLRRDAVIEAIKLLKKDNCNSVVSVEEDYGRYWVHDKKSREYIPFYPKKRELYKPLYKENGAIYFSKYNVIMNKNKLVDDKNVQFIIMEPGALIDIDTWRDWKNAEKQIGKNRK